MSNTTPCGLTGNIGFPYAFNGEIITNNLSKMMTRIHFSFGSMSTSPTLMRDTGAVNITSSNTILYNGTKYGLIYSQVCQPHSLWSLKDANVVAEIIFTFITHDKSANNPGVILLSYLIEKTPKEGTNEFLNSMFSIMPPRKSINIMDLTMASTTHYAYITCIPYLEKSNTIGGLRALCLIGDKSIKVGSELLKQLNFTKYRLPSTILMSNDSQTIISYSVSAGGMTKPEISQTGETFSNSVNVNDQTFSNRFMLFEFVKKKASKTSTTRIEGFVSDPITNYPRDRASDSEGFVDSPNNDDVAEGGNDTNDPNGNSQNGSKFVALDDLKCYPVNKRTDINGNMLLIDPTTGKKMSMSEYLEESKKLNLNVGEATFPENKKNTFIKVIAIIAGVFCGLILLALLFMLVKPYLFKSSKKSVAAAAALGNMVKSLNSSVPSTNPTQLIK